MLVQVAKILKHLFIVVVGGGGAGEGELRRCKYISMCVTECCKGIYGGQFYSR